MKLNDTKASRLDAMFEDYVGELRLAGEEAPAVMLAYTHGIHRLWRPVLGMLPGPARVRRCSMLGQGFGILVFEFAADVPVDVEGVDIDPGFVRRSEALLDRVAGLGFFRRETDRIFGRRHIPGLNSPTTRSISCSCVRYLQFVPEPAQAGTD